MFIFREVSICLIFWGVTHSWDASSGAPSEGLALSDCLYFCLTLLPITPRIVYFVTHIKFHYPKYTKLILFVLVVNTIVCDIWSVAVFLSFFVSHWKILEEHIIFIQLEVLTHCYTYQHQFFKHRTFQQTFMPNKVKYMFLLQEFQI